MQLYPPYLNCFENLRSFSYRYRISGILYLRIQAFYAHSKSKNRYTFRIDPAHLEDFGVYHTRTQYLDPSVPLHILQPAPSQLAQVRSNLGGRLCEGEERRTEAGGDSRAVQPVSKGIQSTFQIADGNVFADDQPSIWWNTGNG